jgi:uncharacterized protein YcnI
MRTFTAAALAFLVAVPALAHVTVAPQQAPVGASQVYKVRVHNDSKVPTASIDLQIPAGVTVESVQPVTGGQFQMNRTGDRVTGIVWKIEIPVGKYVELAFTVRNPSTGTSLNWNVQETFKDGSTIEYSDKPGAKDKSSITTLTPVAR